MSAMSFRSVFMVASCAGAALGCYLVSLRVASERAALEQVETKIVLAQRDIRLLQTEIGTRGRLAQLERWNVRVLALSAPSADQFLDGGFELARMVAPQPKPAIEAPVVLAAAPSEAPKPKIEGAPKRGADGRDEGLSARDLLQTASLKRQLPARAPVEPAKDSGATTAKKTEDSKPAAAKALSSGKAKTAAERKPAAVDPLAPLPTKPKTFASATSKDPARKQ